jgi:hypothetical protein
VRERDRERSDLEHTDPEEPGPSDPERGGMPSESDVEQDLPGVPEEAPAEEE